VHYYWVCALRIDAVKMCVVDAMFTSVFSGTVCLNNSCQIMDNFLLTLDTTEDTH
jgi:hypothetical protein